MNTDELQTQASEIKDSIKEFFDERFRTNLFYGSFIIAWLCTNWQSWYVTFFGTSNDLITKKDFLVGYFKAQGTYHLLCVPFGVALLMIIALPALGYISRISPDFFKAITNRTRKYFWKIDMIKMSIHQEMLAKLSSTLETVKTQSEKIDSQNETIISKRNEIEQLKETINVKDYSYGLLQAEVKHYQGVKKNIALLFKEYWTKIYFNEKDIDERNFRIENNKFIKWENNSSRTFELLSNPVMDTHQKYDFRLQSDTEDILLGYNLEIINALALKGTETKYQRNTDPKTRSVLFLRNSQGSSTSPQSDTIQIT